MLLFLNLLPIRVCTCSSQYFSLQCQQTTTGSNSILPKTTNSLLTSLPKNSETQISAQNGDKPSSRHCLNRLKRFVPSKITKNSRNQSAKSQARRTSKKKRSKKGWKNQSLPKRRTQRQKSRKRKFPETICWRMRAISTATLTKTRTIDMLIRQLLVNLSLLIIMNKKSKQKPRKSPDQDFELIRQKAFKTKQDIEQFYIKNKMKLPPILQSRNMLLQNFNHQNPKMGQSEKKIITEKDEEAGHRTSFIRKNFVQEAPRITKIIFQKSNNQKIKRDYLLPQEDNSSNKALHNYRKAQTITIQNERAKNEEYCISKSKEKKNRKHQVTLEKLMEKIHNRIDEFDRSFSSFSHNKCASSQLDKSKKIILDEENSLCIRKIRNIENEKSQFQTILKKKEPQQEKNSFYNTKKRRKLGFEHLGFNFQGIVKQRQNMIKPRKEEFKEMGTLDPWKSDQQDEEFTPHNNH